MKKQIYGYYESIPLIEQSEEFSCSNMWKASWEKQGWECTMLNRSHAKCSNLHLKLVRKLVDTSNRLPPELTNYAQKMMARYTRWCALHAAGGGWMSDYDVVNINFPPQVAELKEANGTLQVVTKEPAWLFYATQELCYAALTKFIHSDLFEGSRFIPEAEILAVDDKLGLVQELLFHAKKTPLKKRSEEMKELLE